MDKTKKLKGKTEKACADRLRKFMVDNNESNRSVAKGIREQVDVTFTEKTIRTWLKGETYLMMHKWDEILLYIEWVTKNKKIWKNQ